MSLHGLFTDIYIGWPGRALLPWLMKAFPDNDHSSLNQKLFNYRLSRARVVVEHSYGRLKGRWRCLLKHLDVTTCDVPELVAACCVLHNIICEIHGDTLMINGWKESMDRTMCALQPAQALHRLQ